MSEKGDSGGPSAGEELPAANITADEENTYKNVMASTLPKDAGVQNSPPTSTYKADNPLNVGIGAMEDDIEAVIEKKLNLEKEKALDVDSEDFELKWDDDDAINALNDDGSAMETENVAHSNSIGVDAHSNDAKSKNNVTPLTTANQATLSSVGDHIFKVDTSIKIDLANKGDSETNSLDEHLVYSDVDAPEIEDKDLLDELDAHISKTDKTDDSMEEANPVVPEVTQEKSAHDMCQQDHNSTGMDVDNKIIETVEKPNLNDTVSTLTDADASTYDVNMEHKLGNLDAMIEIPTQELIEDLDDSGDFEEGEQYDEDLLLQNDTEVTEPGQTVKDIDTARNGQAKPEESTIKEVLNIPEFDIDLEDKLLADSVKTADGIATTENTDIETKMISENDSSMIESSKLDKMIEMIDKDIEMTEKENYTDIILEASHQDSEDLIDSTDNTLSTNIETIESAPTIDCKSKLDTEIDKSASIADTAADDILLEETKELSKVEDTKPSTNETKEITQSEQNTDTTLTLQATEITELEELTPIVNIETEEVTSAYFSKEVNKTKEITQSEQNTNTTLVLQATEITELKELAPIVNIETEEVTSVYFSKEVSDIKSAKIDDIVDNALSSTSKSNGIQLDDAESQNIEINTAQSLPKESGDAKGDGFTKTQPYTFQPDNLELKEIETKNASIDTVQHLPSQLPDAKVDDFINAQTSTLKTDDLQLKKSETNNVSIETAEPLPKEMEDATVDDFINAQPSRLKSDDLKLKEPETKKFNIDTAEPLPKELEDTSVVNFVSAQPSTSKLNDIQLKQVEAIKVDIDIAQPSISKIDDLQPIESEPKNLDIDLAQLSTSKIDDLQLLESEPKNLDMDVAQPSTSKIDHLQPIESEPKNLDIDLAQPLTSKIDDLQPLESEPKNLDIDLAQPSTSKTNLQPEVGPTNVDIDITQPSTSKADNLPLKDAEAKSIDVHTEQPSTSNLMQELSDEDQETDTLGLLAESSRVMDDDDEQEQDDDDDDDDFDQDEESNQMIAEHSEDSNAQHSETDVPQETMDVEPTEADKEFPDLPEVVSSDAEVTEPVVEESIEVNESEVEMAVTGLISSNLEEDSTDALAVTDIDVKLSSEDSDSSKLRKLLTKGGDKDGAAEESKVTSPSKVKKLEISKPNREYNIVDLEESSSEDDVQEVNRPDQPESTSVTSVNIPCAVEVMAAGGELSKLTQREGEVVISVPKPPPHKPARLNTGEVSIKTGVTTIVEPMLIPEATVSLRDPKPKLKAKAGLEIFSLDSDEEEKEKGSKKHVEELKCINIYCTSDSTVPRTSAEAAAAAYYGGARRGAVCTPCALHVRHRTQSLIEGIKDLTPLLSLDMGQIREELVEISDSESEDEIEVAKKPEDAIGEITAKFLEENLEDMFNSTWLKFNMDERLQEAQKQIDIDVLKIEDDCKEIDSILSECQAATDKLRRDLYDTFAHERKELPPIMIYDTPTNMWSGLEEGIVPIEKPELPTRQSKRRLQAATEPPAKKPAIPLGYTPLDTDHKAQDVKVTAAPVNIPIQAEDDNADISVVKLSAEAAPAGLPPVGTARRPLLRPQMQVYAMRNAFGAWLKAKIVDVQPKLPNSAFTMCRVKFEHKVKNPCKLLPARCLAYDQPSEVRMTIGTRVIALFADTQTAGKSYYSGIVAEIPNPVNNYRYLVFFDDGYAQYVQHAHTRLVCECAPLVWDEVHPFSRQFVRDYLRAYPERPMVRAHAGQSLKTEWNGRWWVSKVIQVDASLVQVHFEEDNRTEWIYRGSTRLAPLYLELQAAERQRARPLPRAAPGRKVNMPYVEYTRSDEPATASQPTPTQAEQELRRQRAVAKKSTALAQPPPSLPLDAVSSRVVFYTPKKTIRPHKMVPHSCGARCRRSDVLALKDLRTYNPLTKPLLSGWERQIVKYRFTKSVMYRAPCGRRIRDYKELHRYLQSVGSDMGVDLFDFGVHTHCLAEFVLNKCLVSKKDLSHGKENVPVPCVNYYDSSLPEFCSYNTERTPTAGVPLNLDPEFLCGCDCTDDCADKFKCACWKMTLEGARTIGLDANDVGYVYKRLPEPLPSGIYECNSRCKCRQTCLNRVAQHPLQLKLQVFKTLNRGWGIRALNDVPKGAFLCVYAGNLLTDATANLDGLNEGDEYLAELDYIEVVEQMKEGFEEDIPDEDKKLDQEAEDSSSSPSSSEEEQDQRKDTEDADFRPEGWMMKSQVSEYSKRLRKRDKSKKKDKENKDKSKEKQKDGSGDDCITISDDEELREPARFAAQAGMGGKEFVSKYKSVRAHFGRDEACYIMDAKVQGNIGRYLNHSCTPNVFVQNVFVDTHDPRFPWVAFFALTHIRAGTELTWNYNYDVGSVPGKVLYCHCAAPNCRGRLL